METYEHYRLDRCFERSLFTRDFVELSRYVATSLRSNKQVKGFLFHPIPWNYNAPVLLPVLSVLDPHSMNLNYFRNGRNLPVISIYRNVSIQPNRYTVDMKIAGADANNNNRQAKQFKDLVESIFKATYVGIRLSREYEAMFHMVDFFRGQPSRFALEGACIIQSHAVTINAWSVDGVFSLTFYLDRMVSF